MTDVKSGCCNPKVAIEFVKYSIESKVNKLNTIDGETLMSPVAWSTSYANDYRSLSVLKRLADAHGIAILLIHHLRKENLEALFAYRQTVGFCPGSVKPDNGWMSWPWGRG